MNPDGDNTIHQSGNLRPPAETCLFCDKSLAEFGGKRLTAQSSRGVTLFVSGGAHDMSGKKGSRVIRLSESADEFVAVWNDGRLVTDTILAKARDAYISGYRPWFCQCCGSRTCPDCGEPLRRPAGSDVLAEDGSTFHVGMLPGGMDCQNKNCDRYRPDH